MTQTADLAIRLARAAFNRALAQGDLAAIPPILSPNAMLITGTDSVVLDGRKAQLQAWKREFAATPRTIYTRTPQSITLSAIEPIAMEQGEWVATSLTQTTAAGIYSAKWRNLAAATATPTPSAEPHWVIEAEIYLTLA